jgi:pimeloyl-ACP methyl ester carboxylesterase
MRRPLTKFNYTFDALADVTGNLLSQLGIGRFALYVQDYGAPVGSSASVRRPRA